MHDFRIKTPSGWHYVRLNSLPRSCGCDGSLTEWLIDALETQCDLMVLPEDLLMVRNLERNGDIGTKTLRLFHNDQNYGGPEEGGWWYNTQRTIRTYRVPAKNLERHRARLQRYCDAYNAELPRWAKNDHLHVSSLPEAQRERPHYC